MNDYLVLMRELNYKIKRLAEDEAEERPRKSQSQRYLDGELKDRQSHTPTHYDRTRMPDRYVQEHG